MTYGKRYVPMHDGTEVLARLRKIGPEDRRDVQAWIEVYNRETDEFVSTGKMTSCRSEGPSFEQTVREHYQKMQAEKNE